MRYGHVATRARMILTRHFVFLHLPKTGGSFFTALMRRHAPAEWQASYHDLHPTAAEIPASHRHLPIIGMVRSPWSFYVSWYHFALDTWQDWPFLQKVSGGGTLSFEQTIRNVQDSDEVRSTGLGGYTMQIVHIYQDRFDDTRFVKVENMRDDLLRVLDGLVELPAGFADAIRTTPKVNVGRHGAIADHYDAELEQLIWERDRPVFEKFGYGRLRDEHP